MTTATALRSSSVRSTQDTTWKQLRPGDEFVCPRTGQTDVVVFNSPTTKQQRLVKTKKHNHIEQPDDLVQLVVDGQDDEPSPLEQLSLEAIGQWIETWTMGETTADQIDVRMAADLVERLSQKGVTLQFKPR